MQMPLRLFVFLFSSSIIAMSAAQSVAAVPPVIELWPKGAPGEKGEIGEEREFTKSTDNQVGG